jgi:hypothetical protein
LALEDEGITWIGPPSRAVVGAAVPVFPRRATKFAQGDDQERTRRLLRRPSDSPSRRSASTLA